MTAKSLNRVLQDFAKSSGPHCVSLHMSVLRGEFDGEQNPIRLKNLLSTTEGWLAAGGLDSVIARDLVQAIFRSTEEPGFWEDGSQGLSIFASPEHIEHYQLPQPVPERAVVGQHYNITPLLPLETDGSFVILELSKHDCRALRGHRFTLEELKVHGLPVRKARPTPEHERHVSLHGARRHRAQRQTVITGGGEPPERSKHEIEKHFRAVDAAMQKYLIGGGEPMVIATLPSLAPIYRQVNTYPHLEAGQIDCEPYSLNDHELHQRAWRIVEPRFTAREQQVLQNCVRLAKLNPSAFTLHEILIAAHESRIATLLVAADTVCWGTFDSQTEQFLRTDMHAPGAEDLLNLAAVETLRHRGQVFTADLSPAGIHELAAANFKFEELVPPAGTMSQTRR